MKLHPSFLSLKPTLKQPPGFFGFQTLSPILLVCFCLITIIGPVHAQNPEPFQSTFTRKPPRIDGRLTWGEWNKAQSIPFEHGHISLLNDHSKLYVLVNVTGQKKPDPRDYLWISFDVDGNKAITPQVDLNYAIEPESRDLIQQLYLGPNEFENLTKESKSSRAMDFDSFLADGSTVVNERFDLNLSKHRVWEMAFDLSEIQSKPGDMVRMGMRIASPGNDIQEDLPRAFTHEFSNLIAILVDFPLVFLPPSDPEAIIQLNGDPLEVTQAVQTRQNDLPLVKDKRTVARVYIDVSNTTGAQPVWVYLYGKRGGVDLPGSPLFKFATVPTTVDRENLNDTPWFLLPDSWPQGNVEFKVKIRTAYGAEQISSPTTLGFTPKQIPDYWSIPINTGTAGTPNLISNAQMNSQESATEAVFPVPDIDYRRMAWTAIGPTTVGNTIQDLNDYYGQVVLAWILGLIFTGSSPFDLPDQVYGFTPSGGGISDPVWVGGLGYVARGFIGSSRELTMAHEINHNMDRDTTGTWGRHAPFGCGATGPDGAWPYGNDDVQEVGFDTRAPITASSVVPANFPDYMSYCQSGTVPTKWISPYHWTNLFNAMPNASGGSLTSQMDKILEQIQPVYYISGELTQDGGGMLRPVLLQPGLPSPRIARGEYQIELLDDRGEILRAVPFMASFVNVEGEKVEKVSFSFQIPAAKETAIILLRAGNRILSRLVLSPNDPRVVVVSPNGGESWKGEQVIRWNAEDPDGDNLVFSVLYSPNNGQRWIPIAANIREQSLQVSSDDLPGGSQALIRVIASDGLRNGEDDSDETFTVINKQPLPVIRLPLADSVWPEGDVVCLRAAGGDLEDLDLPDSAYLWTLHDQVIAIGPKAEVLLPTGRHQVMLTILDQTGQIGQTTQSFLVQKNTDQGPLQIVHLDDGRLRISWPAQLGGQLVASRDVTGPYKDAGLPVEEKDGEMVVEFRPSEKATFFKLLLDL